MTFNKTVCDKIKLTTYSTPLGKAEYLADLKVAMNKKVPAYVKDICRRGTLTESESYRVGKELSELLSSNKKKLIKDGIYKPNVR